MVLQSGVVPYNYDYGAGPFQAGITSCDNYLIGPSGKLLEQAQFVVTAEYRRWRGKSDASVLRDFNVYRHEELSPEGPYEPKADGSTLGNSSNPAGFIFIDHIIQTREALESMLGSMASDTEFTQNEHLQSWLGALYPNNPSGALGNYSRREPSETGQINYVTEDVLGSSGVIYDVDFGEVMYNPMPHITAGAAGNCHGNGPGGSLAIFTLRMAPIFPSFQRTDGSIVGTNGREPTTNEVNNSSIIAYDASHVSLGLVRLDGYMLTSDSEFYLGHNDPVFNRVEDFTFSSASTRNPPGSLSIDNMPDSRVFLTPTPETSGVYRIAIRNPLDSFTNAAVESGVSSRWPALSRYWPTVGSSENDTTADRNIGYEVFNDCFWMTDTPYNGASNQSRYPSGLAIFSPFTGHRMWVRYAELVNDTENTFRDGLNWPNHLGLERPSNNVIVRISPEPKHIEQTDGTYVSSVSGRVIFRTYNDDLDSVSEILSTSLLSNGPTNYFPANIQSQVTFSDVWFDGTFYWVMNNDHVGYDTWKFDVNFEFVDKYSNTRASWVPNNVLHGLRRMKGVYANGQHRLFQAYSGVNSSPISRSGIYPFTTNASPDGAGEQTAGDLVLGQRKDIDGAPFVGYYQFGQIIDMKEITGGTHTPDGVYAVVRWDNNGNGLSNEGIIVLVRIEELSNKWEIKSIYKLSGTSNGFFNGSANINLMHKNV